MVFSDAEETCTHHEILRIKPVTGPSPVVNGIMLSGLDTELLFTGLLNLLMCVQHGKVPRCVPSAQARLQWLNSVASSLSSSVC